MKKSELRQIIREEIQKEIFGLEKYGRGDNQLQQKYEQEAQEESKNGYVVHVNKTKTGFELSDWFDDELTVASYENGRKRGVQPQSFNDEGRATEKAKELSIEDPNGSYYVVEYTKMDGSKMYKIETSYRTEPGKKYRREFKNGEVKTNYVINPYTNMPYTK